MVAEEYQKKNVQYKKSRVSQVGIKHRFDIANIYSADMDVINYGTL